jgi:putative hydrolase of the HAD superfamily
MTRALVFDLDDTLYPERQFALSAFAAVAEHVSDHYGIERCRVFRTLTRSFRRGARASAFQAVTSEFNVPASAVNEMTEVYRAHVPSLRLPALSRQVLEQARHSWRVGVLTNGLPAIQRRKVLALGVGDLVDAVIYAQETGSGKPAETAFRAVCEALGTPATRAVMAGDDPWCDIDGGRRAGLRVIRVLRGLHRQIQTGETGPADATVERIEHVPDAASRLMQEGERRAV